MRQAVVYKVIWLHKGLAGEGGESQSPSVSVNEEDRLLTVALVVSVVSLNSGKHRVRLLAAEVQGGGLLEMETLVVGVQVNTRSRKAQEHW